MRNPNAQSPQALRARLYALLTRTGGGRYRPHELLNFFLNEALARAGVEKRNELHGDAGAAINEATDVYLQLVAAGDSYVDLLGPIYMEMAQAYRGRTVLGQYFSPQTIADLMAGVTIGEHPPDRIVTVCDPACGSGVMPLAFCRQVIQCFGVDALRHLAITCVDIDHYCARMTAVQFIANLSVWQHTLAELVVIQGNSLSDGRDWMVIAHAVRTDLQAARFSERPPTRVAAIKTAAAAAGVPTIPEGIT